MPGRGLLAVSYHVSWTRLLPYIQLRLCFASGRPLVEVLFAKNTLLRISVLATSGLNRKGDGGPWSVALQAHSNDDILVALATLVHQPIEE